MADEKAKKFKFKAEVNKLLDILVHSLYTNREIFLRELISNASDALDKLRFETTKGTEVIDADLPLEINITVNDKDQSIIIADTGFGMTYDEMVKNIGTIAKSGSEEFMKTLEKTAESEDVSQMIGRFGVGFYSVFMAAKEVKILSRSYVSDEKAVEWISSGVGNYQIKHIDDTLKRGTEIHISLRDDAKEFADANRIKTAIKNHSNFISFPINVDKEKVNTISALWREPKFKIKQNEYDEFYKFLTYDYEEPMDTIHTSIDAPVQFNSLVFVPKRSIDMMGNFREDRGLDLYVNGVLIQHKNKDLIPEYLAFLKGLVESPDIPLNISRETLQENLVVQKISSSLVKQVLSFLHKKAKDKPEEYVTFWKEHGPIFKFGHSDYANQEKFAELLRFNSSINESTDEFTSLEEYTGRMKEGQKEIYYLSGQSREAIESDPHLEIFKRKGIEVLFLYDPIDEFCLSGLNKYKDHAFQSAEHADLSNLDKLEDTSEADESTEALSDTEEKVFTKLLERFKDILGDRINEVRESKRLKDSPSCLVNPDGMMTSHMQKIMHIMNKDATPPQKIMEINKDHKLIRNLLIIYKKDTRDPFIDQTIEQLFESALLLEGYLTDPHKLVSRIQTLLQQTSEWHPGLKEK